MKNIKEIIVGTTYCCILLSITSFILSGIF